MATQKLISSVTDDEIKDACLTFTGVDLDSISDLQSSYFSLVYIKSRKTNLVLIEVVTTRQLIRREMKVRVGGGFFKKQFEFTHQFVQLRDRVTTVLAPSLKLRRKRKETRERYQPEPFLARPPKTEKEAQERL